LSKRKTANNIIAEKKFDGVGGRLACGLVGSWLKSWQERFCKSFSCDIGLRSCEINLSREKDGKCIAKTPLILNSFSKIVWVLHRHTLATHFLCCQLNQRLSVLYFITIVEIKPLEANNN
jgi:hypothetical protein